MTEETTETMGQEGLQDKEREEQETNKGDSR